MTQSDKYDLRAPIFASISSCTSCHRFRDRHRTLDALHRTPDQPRSLRNSPWRLIIGVLVFLFAGRALRAQTVVPGDFAGLEGIPPVVFPVSAQQMPRLAVTTPAIPRLAFSPECALEPQYNTRSSIDLQKDWDVGHNLALKIAAEETLVEDPVLTTYLNGLERQLVQDSGLTGCFVVELILDKEVNAYSLPGGFLYLTTGLVMRAQREGELVAALAHETAHVVARHFSRIEHKRKFGHSLMRAGGPAGYLAGQLLGPLFMSKQMRNAEFEADRLSLQYQHDSGYDLGEFTSLLRNIVQPDQDSSSLFGRLFNTHPSINARLRRLETQGSRVPATQVTSKGNDEDFRTFKEYFLSHFARH